MALKHIHIGTAGFSYRDWQGNFYPQFCPPADFLRCYSMTFETVELDSTFYRIPTGAMIDKWAKITPERFKFSAKFPRTVTHEGNLQERVAEAKTFLKVISGLGEKLGPVLFQFPGSFRPERKDTLEALLDTIPKGVRAAAEFRCSDWITDELAGMLRERGVGLCLTDYPSMPKLDLRTTDFAYVRFIGDHRGITEDFSYVRDERREDLSWWEDLIARFAGEKAEIFAYFNNHYTGHAPSTALSFKESLDRRLG